MPNWCVNNLKIEGDKEKVAEFIAKGEGKAPQSNYHLLDEKVYPFLLNSYIPVPGDILEKGMRSDIDQARSHWCCANWGTRNDLYDADITVTDDGALVYFNTAWSPPDKWLEKVSYMYPSLHFTLSFFEPACRLAGQLIFDPSGRNITIDYKWGSQMCDQFLIDEFRYDTSEDE